MSAAASSSASAAASASNSSGSRFSEEESDYLFRFVFSKKFAIFLIVAGFITALGIYLFT